MAWVFLFFAGILEIAWADLMKQSDGFSRIIPFSIMVVAMIGSFWLLALALRTLPLGTAYAIWTGIGVVGSFIVGIMIFGEALTLMRVLSVSLIFDGMVGLKLSTS